MTDTAQLLAAAETRLEEINGRYLAARQARDDARGDVAELRNRLAAERKTEQRQRWVDPLLEERLAEAERIVPLAEAELATTAARLRIRYTAKVAKDQAEMGRNRVLGAPPLREIDHVGMLVADDPEYVTAERTLRLVKRQVSAARQAVAEHAQRREYQATTAERNRRIANRRNGPAQRWARLRLGEDPETLQARLLALVGR